jgi:tRNA-dihydrouridine synthase A
VTDAAGRAARLSAAPMMEVTDRHFRFLLRLISRRTLLYTEMVHAGAILRGDRERFLRFHADEHPVALQLGGSDPADLAEAARAGADRGYDEINLNCGCPSPRVTAGSFGACLMREPDLVARCVEAMARAVPVPVTVKCRLAVDDMEEWPTLRGFVGTVAAAGCTRFVVHARKAWLEGLSPKENRDVPPLDHAMVHRLKAERPDLHVSVNGGIRTLDEALPHLGLVDGVMIGRGVQDDPWVLAEADSRVFGEAGAPAPDRAAVVAAFADYADAEMRAGTPLAPIARAALPLFAGMPGARAWRRRLGEEGRKPGRGPEVFAEALDLVRAAAAGARERAAA